MLKNLFIYLNKTIFISIIGIFIAIILYILYHAIIYFDISLLEKLLPPMYGTIALIFLSVIFALPLGIATAIYINSYSTKRVKNILEFSFKLLASIPSIVVGLFGFILLVIMHNFYDNFKSSLLLSSLSLSILVLPYIVKTTLLGLKECQKEYINIAYSLGASKDKVIFKILLPFAKNHILKSIYLSIARSAEDTAVIMLTGVVASYGYFDSLFSPFEALPFYIYQATTNYSTQEELNSIFIAVVMIMILSSTFMILSKGAVRYVRD